MRVLGTISCTSPDAAGTALVDIRHRDGRRDRPVQGAGATPCPAGPAGR
jgi:hypothetical protein